MSLHSWGSWLWSGLEDNTLTQEEPEVSLVCTVVQLGVVMLAKILTSGNTLTCVKGTQRQYPDPGRARSLLSVYCGTAGCGKVGQILVNKKPSTAIINFIASFIYNSWWSMHISCVLGSGQATFTSWSSLCFVLRPTICEGACTKKQETTRTFIVFMLVW
jgi:hypothetical protein